MHVAVVQPGDDGVPGGVDDFDIVGGRPRVGVHASTGPIATIVSPSISTEPGSRTAVPPVMGRTMPLRIRVRVTPQGKDRRDGLATWPPGRALAVPL
jgi:mRNA-degrading endonuclease toxin of MazEF toxin-antitoxin module